MAHPVPPVLVFQCVQQTTAVPPDPFALSCGFVGINRALFGAIFRSILRSTCLVCVGDIISSAETSQAGAMDSVTTAANIAALVKSKLFIVYHLLFSQNDIVNVPFEGR